MLAVIPILVFLAIFLYLLGRQQGEVFTPVDWRGTFLQASIIWGAIVVVLSESLSLFSAIMLPSVALLWALILGAVIWIGWRRGAFPKAWSIIRLGRRGSLGRDEWLLLGAVFAVVSILWLLAWKSPPNTVDSLRYHMSRAAHWTQNRGLKHYATVYEPQLMHPIWAETAILHLRLLWGGDNPVALIQWFSMVGSLIGVSAIASLLGAGRREQFLAAAFAVSIPMGVLQATSTQNDYVTAFWLVCLAYFILLGKVRALRREEWFLMSLALGLGMLTKGTFYIYAFPFLLWFTVPRLFDHGFRKTLKEGVGVAAVALALNMGYFARNILTYGKPFGSSQWMKGHIATQFKPASLLSSWVNDLALNLTSPFGRVNEMIFRGVEWFHSLIGTDTGGFDMVYSWNHEDLAGNLLHLILFLLSFIGLLILSRCMLGSLPVRYALITIISFLLLSSILGFNVYSVRFQLPLFVLWAPVVGVVVWRFKWTRGTVLASTLLVIAALPWVFLNRSRPIIGYYPYTMMSESVFREPQEISIFANITFMGRSYTQVAEAVKESSCRDVGLRIDSHHWEYPYWWLLDANESGIRIEHLETYTHLERYIDEDFEPCAIICMVCGDRDRLHGLELTGDYGEGIALYTGSGYTPDEDG